MGYMYKDKDDDLESALLTGRIMARALGIMLQEREGMVIELPSQEDYPDDPYGKFFICKIDGEIQIGRIGDDEVDELKNADHGNMFWNHSGQQ